MYTTSNYGAYEKNMSRNGDRRKHKLLTLSGTIKLSTNEEISRGVIFVTVKEAKETGKSREMSGEVLQREKIYHVEWTMYNVAIVPAALQLNSEFLFVYGKFGVGKIYGNQKFRECFYLFARNGQIRTLDELTIIMRSLGLSPTIAELNKYLKDKGGKMSFADFLEVMHLQTRAEDLPKEVIDAFQAADKFRTGTIPARQLAHMLLHWGEQLSNKEVEQIFREANVSPNGHSIFEINKKSTLSQNRKNLFSQQFISSRRTIYILSLKITYNYQCSVPNPFDLIRNEERGLGFNTISTIAEMNGMTSYDNLKKRHHLLVVQDRIWPPDAIVRNADHSNSSEFRGVPFQMMVGPDLSHPTVGCQYLFHHYYTLNSPREFSVPICELLDKSSCLESLRDHRHTLKSFITVFQQILQSRDETATSVIHLHSRTLKLQSFEVG
ncbi:Calmodulin-like protein 4 [Melipona quadrifasciata]|uniref:Calmodulin-like protein 4 n=1 Tax=Melipona quadrifasciata TaxID=166423 RepID=A0A0N0U4F4_9HYME|nr:Calmodulin-like protein 4 [Melipona quadrifasciata]